MAKRAFITGAAGGIGAGIARRLSQDGYIVAMADINADVVSAAQAVVGAVPVQVDVSDSVALGREIDAFAKDGLDVLVNNAVMFHYQRLQDTPAQVANRMIDVGLKGALWGTQVATPHLIARGGGASSTCRQWRCFWRSGRHRSIRPSRALSMH
jgi:NAD(P)-dependent dehydrogenase (short-subunit alcohol dehydrogenase family)